MKTITATQARQSLGAILSRVLEGEDIGSEDYALMEYDVTANELKCAVRNIGKQANREKTKRWDGTPKGRRG
jgi:hypothetical protein